MELLLAFLMVVLKALLPILFDKVSEASTRSAQDGVLQTALRTRLIKRVRDYGWIFLVVCITGCSMHTIYVPAGEPVRLRETIKNAKVWVMDSNGELVAGKMDLPEGWYCLPDEEE